jgi:hypothetical protein
MENNFKVIQGMFSQPKKIEEDDSMVKKMVIDFKWEVDMEEEGMFLHPSAWSFYKYYQLIDDELKERDWVEFIEDEDNITEEFMDDHWVAIKVDRNARDITEEVQLNVCYQGEMHFFYAQRISKGLDIYNVYELLV